MIACARAPATRSFSTSASSRKASPHLFDVSASHGGGPAARPHPPSSNQEERALRVVMFGKPGSGKGTLSSRLTDKYDVSFISSGDALRRHIAEKSEVGRAAEQLVAKGAFVSDEVMLRVVKSDLEKLHQPNWILDGFPRTLPQARMLDDYLLRRSTPLTLIVHLDVPDSIILSRIQERWIHLPSGRVYNLSYNPPKVPGLDDVTSEPLSKRPDDTPSIFARRLSTFQRETAPLLSYYASPSSLARLVSLKGETSDEIWPKLEAELGEFEVGLKKEAAGKGRVVQEEVIRRAEEEESGMDEVVVSA